MPLSRLTRFLDDHHVSYHIKEHPIVFTAQQTAQVSHVPGKQMAKSVLVKLDGMLALAVVPASYRVNLNDLAAATGSLHASLASEEEVCEVFSDCEPGGMPPFGNLWKVPVLVSRTLSEDSHISFNAGNHKEIITLSYDDFEKLVHPKVLAFSSHT